MNTKYVTVCVNEIAHIGKASRDEPKIITRSPNIWKQIKCTIIIIIIQTQETARKTEEQWKMNNAKMYHEIVMRILHTTKQQQTTTNNNYQTSINISLL